MINKEIFSLNHILSPNLLIEDFIKLVKNIDLKYVEIRNDLPNINLQDQIPEKIRELSIKNNIKILTINALQKFNIWNKERENELIFLCNFAKKCDCRGIVLVPLNTGEYTAYNERNNILRNSLKNISNIMNDFELIGYVEPLGFKTSSLRLKKEVIEIINSINSKQSLRILHDTFHHYLSEEKNIYPEYTGLVHISGVSNTKLKSSNILDEHRVLIDKNDILKNVDQITELIHKGYSGNFSFEPFSKKIQNIKNPSNDIIDSINYLVKNCKIS
tara:strand:- start:58 stop:879 length:822 start_codon:yes stop_codon:yes gene_type:complete